MRVLVLADLHCGGKVGLTPPRWHLNEGDKWNKHRIALWNDFQQMLKPVLPVDVLVLNGDTIDGDRPSGRERFVYDRGDQADMVVDIVSQINAPSVHVVSGTFGHAGLTEDWEELVADKLEAPHYDQLFLEVHGITFDFKHRISGTRVPHNKGYQLGLRHLWNLLWEERGIQPRADITVRSHVHTFWYTGDDRWLGITTPALCGYGGRYGTIYFDNTIQVGFVYFDCEEGGKYDWSYAISAGEYLKTPPVVV